MTIFITWQLIVTLDNICNSCNVLSFYCCLCPRLFDLKASLKQKEKLNIARAWNCPHITISNYLSFLWISTFFLLVILSFCHSNVWGVSRLKSQFFFSSFYQHWFCGKKNKDRQYKGEEEDLARLFLFVNCARSKWAISLCMSAWGNYPSSLSSSSPSPSKYLFDVAQQKMNLVEKYLML